MVKVLIVYHSRTGNTQKMAEYVKAGVEEAGALAILKRAEEAIPEDMNTADAVIIGSPTYYGLPAAEIMSLVDKSIKFHGEFEGKVGGAFASSANKGGGNETTIMAIIQALLIHGMIIPGSSKGDHYGPVSIGKPDEDVRIQCMNLGKRTVLVTSKLKASKTG